MDNELHKQIEYLVTAACRQKKDSPQRRRYLTQIIRLIQQSNGLWKEPVPYYEDALQQTWLYFCLNLCEATTAGEAYNPKKSQITTWLNAYLKRRLQDCKNLYEGQKKKQVFTSDEFDPIASLEAPPDIPPLLQELTEWAETDFSGELRKIHLKGRKDITCQLLILRRLPPESSWKQLSEEFGVSISTLSTFYERQCRPRLRQFTEQQGY